MADEITPEATPAFDPTALSDADLSAAFAAARERGAELSAKAEFAAGEAEELAELATRVQLLQTEHASRNQRATEQQAQRDVFASLGDLPPIASPQPVAAPVAPVEPAPVSPAPVVPSVAQMAAQRSEERRVGKECRA